MTPYRVDVRRPDGWHTLTVRAASPEMATSYALRSTHDALEARQAVVDGSAAPAPQNDPETPHRRNNGVSSWEATRYPDDWLPDDYDPACVEVQHGDRWEYRNGSAAIVARNAWPPPKPGTHESDLPVLGAGWPGLKDYQDARRWSRENSPPWKAQGRVLPAGGVYLIGEESPPPKPDMTIAWGITEALIEDRGR